jgi:hypothetical protein
VTLHWGEAQDITLYKVWKANSLFWTERSEGKRELACHTLYYVRLGWLVNHIIPHLSRFSCLEIFRSMNLSVPILLNVSKHFEII